MAMTTDIDRIRRAAATLGVTFPSSFVERLLLRNGGDVAIEEEVWSLNQVSEIVAETENGRRWPNFPPGGVCIASNGLGDHLVLLPGTIQRHLLQAAVFMWSHETGELDRVADNLAELKTEET